MHGGGHERGMRSGTLATHQIVGMGEAAAIAKADMEKDNERIRYLRDKLWNGIKDIEETYLNGDMEQRACGSLNVSFNYVEGESLMMALKDLAVSSGSACTSASLEPAMCCEPGAERRDGAQLNSFLHRSFHFRGRDRLRNRNH